MGGLPRWAVVTAGGLLAVVAASLWDMALWAWAAALGLSIVAVVSLIRYQIMPLIIATALCVGAALAMTDAAPVWSVALCGVAAVVSGVAGRRMARARPAVAVFATGVAGGLALTVFDRSAWVVTLALGAVVPWLGGRYLRQQADLAHIQAQQARLRERARIAHDMHDSLGHELSLLALRAGALQLDPSLPPQHQKAAGELRAGAAAVIGRLAGIVGVMREGEPAPLEPSGGAVADLVHRSASAGMDVTLTWHGPDDLPST
ncbi:MAG TPA: histidine kinase dimerization/phosphoacceptor domain-containing protein, partial [Trebonia sp.]